MGSLLRPSTHALDLLDNHRSNEQAPEIKEQSSYYGKVGRNDFGPVTRARVDQAVGALMPTAADGIDSHDWIFDLWFATGFPKIIPIVLGEMR